MLEEKGNIIARDKEAIWVETSTKTVCSSCQSKTKCASGLIEDSFKQRRIVNKIYTNEKNINDTMKLQVGEQVKIAVPGNVVIKGSIIVYMVPLICLIIATATANFYFSSELVIITLGVTGLFCGFIIASYWTKNMSRSQILSPRLLSPQTIKERHNEENV